VSDDIVIWCFYRFFKLTPAPSTNFDIIRQFADNVWFSYGWWTLLLFFGKRINCCHI